MALNQLRDYIRRAILPLSDLGIAKESAPGLVFPDDTPPRLAILSALRSDTQAATLVRVGADGRADTPKPWTILLASIGNVSSTSQAFNLPDLTPYNEVFVAFWVTATTSTAGTGVLQMSPDGGTTWFQFAGVTTGTINAAGFWSLIASRFIGSLSESGGSGQTNVSSIPPFPMRARLQGLNAATTFNVYVYAR